MYRNTPTPSESASPHNPATCRNGDHYGQCAGATLPFTAPRHDQQEDVAITVIPDPCWTPEAEAAAQSWLDLIRHLTGSAS